jgi:hypothetical protein
MNVCRLCISERESNVSWHWKFSQNEELMSRTCQECVCIANETEVTFFIFCELNWWWTPYHFQVNICSPLVCTVYFNISKLCILPPQCICVSFMVFTVNSNCFTKQHWPIGICSGGIMFSVRYELNPYILFGLNLLFKMLNYDTC